MAVVFLARIDSPFQSVRALKSLITSMHDWVYPEQGMHVMHYEVQCLWIMTQSSAQLNWYVIEKWWLGWYVIKKWNFSAEKEANHMRISYSTSYIVLKLKDCKFRSIFLTSWLAWIMVTKTELKL